MRSAVCGDLEGAAELVERARGGGGALGEGRVRRRAANGEAATDGPEQSDEIAVGDAVAERAEEARGERSIGGGEFGLGGWRDAVLVGRLAAYGTVARVPFDEPVALEEGELGADGRGGDAEGLCELVGGSGVVEELVEDLGPGVAERGSDPAGNRHWGLSGKAEEALERLVNGTTVCL